MDLAKGWQCTLLVGIVCVTCTMTNASRSAEKDTPKKDSTFSDYRKWKRINSKPIHIPDHRYALCSAAIAPGEKTDPDPNGPHADGYVNVYVNSVGHSAFVDDTLPKFNVGTVIVKEKLATKHSKEPAGLGVMVKRERGFAPEAGDWEFLFTRKDGTISQGKSTASCMDCHKQAAKRDFAFRSALYIERHRRYDSDDNEP